MPTNEKATVVKNTIASNPMSFFIAVNFRVNKSRHEIIYKFCVISEAFRIDSMRPHRDSVDQ